MDEITLRKMALHERVRFTTENLDYWIMRVVGGWIYETWDQRVNHTEFGPRSEWFCVCTVFVKDFRN
jgi:hypothetical protein